jgi:hypothetical protein
MVALAVVLMVTVPLAHATTTVFTPSWYDRGYIEAAAKLPMSSTNANYTHGYNTSKRSFEMQIKMQMNGVAEL